MSLHFPISKSKIGLILVVAGLALLLLAWRASQAQNYIEPNYPAFAGNYAVPPTRAADTITVISYNIEYARKVEQAIAELRAIEAQHGADIILLQEMDETAAAQIAQALAVNYIYFPSAVEPFVKKNFGTAILSAWPIETPRKLILPHPNLLTRLNRSATVATVVIRERKVLVYSAHTETIFTLPGYRHDQFMAILNDIDTDAEWVIVGGDFNSVTAANVAEKVQIFGQAGLNRAPTGDENTFEKHWLFRARADHIFSKGFTAREAGIVADTSASDHRPIWAKLAFDR